MRPQPTNSIANCMPSSAQYALAREQRKLRGIQASRGGVRPAEPRRFGRTTSVAGGKNIHAPAVRCAVLSGCSCACLSGWQRETSLTQGPGARGCAGFSVRAGGLRVIIANKLTYQIPGTVSKSHMVRIGAGCRELCCLLPVYQKACIRGYHRQGTLLNSVRRRWCGRSTSLESKAGVYRLTPFMLGAVGSCVDGFQQQS